MKREEERKRNKPRQKENRRRSYSEWMGTREDEVRFKLMRNGEWGVSSYEGKSEKM